MSFQIIIRVCACSALLALGGPFSALAQHGHELATDTCVLHIGPYKMYFNSYLPDTYYDRQFCQELPTTGNTVLVLDYVEQELRSLPVEVRIIKDTGSEQNLEAITIAHLPPKVYPTGSVDVKYKFESPGKYVGVVTVGEKQEHVSRFPFSIGESGTISHLMHYIMIIVPLAKPGLAVTMILTWVFAWNEYLFAATLTSVHARTVTTGLAEYVTVTGTNWGQMAATATLAILPALAFLGLVQRHIVAGLTFGALKG